MTNKDRIILELQKMDQENVNAADYIECPYTVFDDCLMDKRGLFDYDSPEGLAACRACKASWLLKEENNGPISNI